MRLWDNRLQRHPIPPPEMPNKIRDRRKAREAREAREEKTEQERLARRGTRMPRAFKKK
jgi:hypothetical protein